MDIPWTGEQNGVWVERNQGREGREVMGSGTHRAGVRMRGFGTGV